MADIDMTDLSKAIVLFLQYGSAKSPRADEDRVIAEFGESKGRELLKRVHAIIEEANAIPVDWSKHTLASAGKLVRDEMHRRYPGLSDDALDALAWKFTFDWR
jgi:hypothetical protein